MVLAETSPFGILDGRNVRGRNVRGRNVLAEMSVAETTVAEISYILYCISMSNTVILYVISLFNISILLYNKTSLFSNQVTVISPTGADPGFLMWGFKWPKGVRFGTFT